MKFSVFLFALNKDNCHRINAPSEMRYFSGSTGLSEWLSRVLEAIDSDDKAVQDHHPSSLAHDMKFVVKLEASATPKWMFAPATVDASASSEVTDTYFLEVDMGPAKKDELAKARKEFAEGRAPKVGPKTQKSLADERDRRQLKSLTRALINRPGL